MVFSMMTSFSALAIEFEKDIKEKNIEDLSDNLPIEIEPGLEIIDPQSGYLHLFKLSPIKMPLANLLGLEYSVVIGRNLKIDTNSNDIYQVKFVSEGQFTGWKSTRWDCKNRDGLSIEMDINSGLYDITAIGYDEQENEVTSDAIKVLFLKIGGDDFGININTRYNSGETFSKTLDIGLVDFANMLNTGESKKFSVTMQNEEDTDVELSFKRTKILNNQENVIETKLNLETNCDTTKDYEVELEIKFPYIMLDGGQPENTNNPFFSAKVGYKTESNGEAGENKVETTFYFGRESIDDPRVFRMQLKPDNIESDTKLTLFNSYVAVDGTGNEVFHRVFSVGFEPATELTITSIPSEAKIRYDFGESAGKNTKIDFRAEGGLLDDIIQTYKINPLPSHMSFDLTVIGNKEFIYESDREFDASYTINSIQNGELVSFEVDKIPEKIHASWGLNIGEFGDLTASSFAELNMTSDVDKIALYLLGNEIPIFELDNFPRKVRFESYIDIPAGVGNISLFREVQETKDVDIILSFNDLIVTKSIELENNYVKLSWDLNIGRGTGNIKVERDSDSEVNFETTIQCGEWIFAKSLGLKNSFVELAWDVDREQRVGSIQFSRAASGGNPTISASISNNEWGLSDTIELKNNFIEFYWDLPTEDNNHAELGINTAGDELFYNTLSLIDDSTEILSLGIGVKTEDNFHISWDNNDGVISNFEWEGKILKLSELELSMHLPGDVLTLDAEWDLLDQNGLFSLATNKDLDITFADLQSDRFMVDGHLSFYENRPLDISWQWGELGHFTVDTNSQPIGEDFSLKFYWDPQAQGNYKYGFNITAPDFLDTYFQVSWYKDPDYMIPYIWIIGDLPDNWGQWEKTLLWNYDWWEVS